MCGIFGFVSKKGTLSDEIIDSTSQWLKDSLAHRGPDGDGVFLSNDKRVLMGHVRLSIIDLDGAKQPMHSSNGDLVVSYNGEIYNYLELRQELEYDYVTSSDTEVIFPAYMKKGSSCSDYFNGMYAYSILDTYRELITFSVDPLAIKSLYIYETSELLVFSSELSSLVKCVLKFNLGELTASLPNISEYLFHGFFIGAGTAFNEISKMQPGENRVYSLASGKCFLKETFNTEYKKKESSCSLEERLSNSVSRQVRSDVSLTTFLSGGVDSSLVALFLAKLGIQTNVDTVSFDNNPEIDESEKAKLVADQLGMAIRVFDISNENLEDMFRKAILSSDEPICDPAVIPLYFLASKVKGRDKVCLVGDGGDEFFYGYTHHKFWFAKVLLNQLPFFRKQGVDFLSDISYWLEGSKYPLANKAGLAIKLLSPYSISYGPFSNCSKFLNSVPMVHGLSKSISTLAEFERKNSLARKLLQKTDRITMAHSIEARVPLMDLEIVESSPFSSFVKNLGKRKLKYILNRDMTRKNEKKQGFRVPLASWLRANKDEVERLLSESRIMPAVTDYAAVKNIFYEFYSGRDFHAQRIYSIYSLLLWLEWIGFEYDK